MLRDCSLLYPALGDSHTGDGGDNRVIAIAAAVSIIPVTVVIAITVTAIIVKRLRAKSASGTTADIR